MTSAEQTIKFIDRTQVEAALNWPLVNAAVEQAFLAVSAKQKQGAEQQLQAYQPARVLTHCHDNGILFAMPGYVGNYHNATDAGHALRSTLACKLVTSFPGNEQRQPPLANILAHILLFDTCTGRLECVMEGTQITGWRTAAASVVATRALYFERNGNAAAGQRRPIKLAIIGVGVQGRAHARGMCATYAISDVYLWNRTASRAHAFADELRGEEDGGSAATRVHVANSAAEAVADVDVICVATYAAEALITADMLPAGRSLHINTVGAGQVHFGEVAQDIYARAKVYVDSWSSAKAELSGLQAPIIAEVGEVLNGAAQRPAQGDITIFQSMGMAAEDATVAQFIYDKLK